MKPILYNIQELFEGGGSKLKVGVHENVKLVDVETGENYIDFHFEKNGKTANKRIWYPTRDKVYPKKDLEGNEIESVDQALLRTGKDSLMHIRKIMDIFLSEEIIKTFQPSTFEDTCKRAATLLNAAKDSATVNLMLIYDQDGVFPTFGRYPNYIEKYVPGKPSALKPSKWEEEHRMTASNAPDLGITNSGDLPF